jgi:hypothetical protein
MMVREEEDMEELRVKVHTANLEGADNRTPQLARKLVVDVQTEEDSAVREPVH